jgi:hypothetical protein
MRSCWLLVLLVLGGCADILPKPAPAPAPKTAPVPVANLTGYPLEFKQGHADGCASARGTRKRDENRFKSDESYAQGWRDGFDFCGRRK